MVFVEAMSYDLLLNGVRGSRKASEYIATIHGELGSSVTQIYCAIDRQVLRQMLSPCGRTMLPYISGRMCRYRYSDC